MNAFPFVVELLRRDIEGSLKPSLNSVRQKLLASDEIALALEKYARTLGEAPFEIEEPASLDHGMEMTVGDAKRLEVIRYFSTLSEEEILAHGQQIESASIIAQAFGGLPENEVKKINGPARLLVEISSVLSYLAKNEFDAMSRLNLEELEMNRDRLLYFQQLTKASWESHVVEESEEVPTESLEVFHQASAYLGRFLRYAYENWGFDLDPSLWEPFLVEEADFPFKEKLASLEGPITDDVIVQLARISDDMLQTKQLPPIAAALTRLRQLELLMIRGDEGNASRILKYVQSLAVNAQPSGDTGMIFWRIVYDSARSFAAANRNVPLNKGFLRMIEDSFSGQAEETFRNDLRELRGNVECLLEIERN